MSDRTATSPPENDWQVALLWAASLLLVLVVHIAAFRLLARVAPTEPLPEPPPAILLELAPAEPAIAAPPPVPFVPPAPPEAVTPPPMPDVIPDIPVPPDMPAAPPVIPVTPPPKPHPQRPVERQAQRPPAHPMERPVTPQPAAEAPAAPAPAPPQHAPPAPSAAAPSPLVVATWQSRLLAHLERFKQFPMAAQRRGEQGIVLMRFRMDRGGHVLSVALVHSCGYADLDAEAQAWITRADPMPALPAEMTQTAMELTVPLHFELR